MVVLVVVVLVVMDSQVLADGPVSKSAPSGVTKLAARRPSTALFLIHFSQF